MPPFLRHLYQLTGYFRCRGEPIPYIHVGARPSGPEGEGPLHFIEAKGRGYEGIACVSDAARAAILALQVYEWTRAAPALALARQWLRFVVYMRERDGRFTNFILDDSGTKNRYGASSYTGGAWWTARALWALATGWRVTRDPRYLRCFRRGRLERTENLKVLAIQALALLELYEAHPDEALRQQICERCEIILASGNEYFRDLAGQAAVDMWGYHQLQAVARAGRLFARLDFLRAGKTTVESLVEPVIGQGFFHQYPCLPEPQCAYDISPLVLGLEELHRAFPRQRYRALALACASWLDFGNPAGVPVYDRSAGRCADAVHQEEVSLNCGAESAIEAGFMELARSRLQDR